MMDNYNIRYYVMILLGVIAVIAGGIAGYQHFTSTAPSWLTPDVGGTCAIVAGIAGGLVALIQQTPGTVAKTLIKARAGVLPKFVIRNYLSKPGA